jgi:HSP20 family protein
MSEKKEKVSVKGKEKVSVKAKQKETKGEIAPWHPPEYMQEMDRWLGDFRRGVDDMFASLESGWGWVRPRVPWLAMPDVRHARYDLIDAGNEFRVRAEVPGITKEKLDVTVTGRGVEIVGEAKTDIQEEREGFVRRERGYSKIQRSLAFPEEVIPEKAEASLKDGLLEINVPKKIPTQVRKHRVEIK